VGDISLAPSAPLLTMRRRSVLLLCKAMQLCAR
jgi:hypothetical protein